MKFLIFTIKSNLHYKITINSFKQHCSDVLKCKPVLLIYFFFYTEQQCLMYRIVQIFQKKKIFFQIENMIVFKKL